MNALSTAIATAALCAVQAVACAQPPFPPLSAFPAGTTVKMNAYPTAATTTAVATNQPAVQHYSPSTMMVPVPAAQPACSGGCSSQLANQLGSPYFNQNGLACVGGCTGPNNSLDYFTNPVGGVYSGANVCAPGAMNVPSPFSSQFAMPGPHACGPVRAAPSRWFGSAYGLIMTRDKDKDLFVGYDDADPMTQLLTTRDAAMDFSGGVEAHVGRHLNNCWSVEGVYWGLFPSQQVARLFASDVTGNVDSPFEFDYLEYDNGTGSAAAGTYFEDTQLLRVLRRYEYHNVEVNFLRRPVGWNSWSCRPVRFGLLAGVRYLQLKEVLDIDSDVANNAFGDDMANEVFYDVNVGNHLVGFQMGGQLDYCLTDRLSLQAGSKMGIYANHMTHRQTLWGGNGNAVISATSPLGYAGSAYSSTTTKDDVAFVGELLTGLSYCLTPRWTLQGGYRAVVASGVALPTGQIPLRFDDLASVGNIDSSDSLILHGVRMGATYNW